MGCSKLNVRKEQKRRRDTYIGGNLYLLDPENASDNS